jgi:glucose/mannose-6-phosphate isomerase
MKYQGKDLAKFAQQIRFALENYRVHGLSASSFDNVLLCGLGGSGIAGRIVKNYFVEGFPLPVEVVSDYVLPAYTGKRTLAIMCSYSGNTEETLAMYEMARLRGAVMLCIATGGILKTWADRDGVRFYQAESGYQPRMALGYSLTYMFQIFSELLGTDMRPDIGAAADTLAAHESYIEEARRLTDQMIPHFPRKIIVITDYFSNPIGLRFCQQVQENTKAEAFLHELPESNHNVIESYYGQLDSIFLFLNAHTHPRTGIRFNFLRDLLAQEGNRVLEMSLDKDSLTDVLQKSYILDWVSLLLAEYKNVNSSDIRNINALKDFLGRN